MTRMNNNYCPRLLLRSRPFGGFFFHSLTSSAFFIYSKMKIYYLHNQKQDLRFKQCYKYNTSRKLLKNPFCLWHLREKCSSEHPAAPQPDPPHTQSWCSPIVTPSPFTSRVFSHPSTNQARSCLASEIRRGRAHSGWYGRRLPGSSHVISDPQTSCRSNRKTFYTPFIQICQTWTLTRPQDNY